jgi:mono/diheme cytochrome c family protein
MSIQEEERIMKKIKLTALTLVAAFALPVSGADKLDIGKVEYDQSCATCHGLDGKGKGSFSEALQLSVPDITTLAKRNGDVFPVKRIYDVIDGRELVKAHGTREMPIWGKHYAVSAAPRYDDYSYNPEAAARGRILALIDYLHRLQRK